MITLRGRPRRFCDGLTRRDALRAGSLAMLGSSFGLPALPEAAAAPDSGRRARAKSVIFLFLHGGAPTQDKFDR